MDGHLDGSHYENLFKGQLEQDDVNRFPVLIYLSIDTKNPLTSYETTPCPTSPPLLLKTSVPDKLPHHST